MVIEIVLLLGFGVLAFHMRVLGSVFTILLLTNIRAISFGGLGCSPPAVRRKSKAWSGLMNLVMPMWIFSGVFLLERFPAMLQPFIKLLPLTAERCLAGRFFRVPHGGSVRAPAGPCAMGNLLRFGSSLVPLDLINLLKSCESAALMAH